VLNKVEKAQGDVDIEIIRYQAIWDQQGQDGGPGENDVVLLHELEKIGGEIPRCEEVADTPSQMVLYYMVVVAGSGPEQEKMSNVKEREDMVLDFAGRG
jgi:hypothetical protein